MFAATFAAIAWAFDFRTSAWVLILLALSPVNEGTFVGGFLQYDWFCTFAIGFCFFKKRHPVIAAAFISYAVLARIFPAVLLGCGIVALFWNWRRHRIVPARYLSFYGSLAIFLAAGIIAGSLGSGGNKAWPEFVAKISFHSGEHTYGEQRIGLKQIFTREIFSIAEETSQEDHLRNHEANLIFYRASALAMILLLFAGLKYTRTQDAILIGLAALFALTVSSRYDWSYLSLLPLLSTVTGSSKNRRLFAILSQCIIFLGVFVYDYTLNPDRYISYNILNVLLLFYLVALAAWPLASRLVRSRYGSLQISHSPRPSL